ncbi:hypothetical protein ROHU_013440 [Labeo rohita]|uniref:Uncharacterized protein n=1 Tax=Labeo rohita TaxID=84645 RepID=A0A498L4U6_LABRO|nr:hypothetical protein ROHU_013440 [Labeo rohita]
MTSKIVRWVGRKDGALEEAGVCCGGEGEREAKVLGSSHCCGGEEVEKAPAVGTAGQWERAPAVAGTAGQRYCCGSGKWRTGSCGSNSTAGGNTEEAPAGADTTAERLLREQALLGQWGNAERAPAVAGCCWDGWSGDEPLWVVLVVSKGVAMVGLKFE